MNTLKRWMSARTDMLNLGLVLILGSVSSQALAFNTYLSDFNTNYSTQGTRIDNCGLCHFNFNGAGPLTPYGEDFRNNNYSIPAIGQIDSDGDASSNDQEASLLTNPGLSCRNLTSAQNAPANITSFVDPANPAGCVATGSPPIVNMNGTYVGVTGNPISFSSAGSFDPDGSIVSYLWNFGTGYGTSTEANPVFTYIADTQLKILVSLTVTDNDGNTTSSSTFVTVLQSPNDPPIANAGLPVTGVVNSPVRFNGSASSDPDGTGFLSYYWNFGDGSFSSFESPTHSYNRCGTYNVSLQVTDVISLTNTATTLATIASSGQDLPVAHAGGGVSRFYNGQVGTNVQFDGSGSSDPDCNIVSYNWDFGDGTSGIGMSPLHNYIAGGNYVVTLTVTDNDGLQGTDVATVSVINTGPLDGTALYQTNCAACHGAGVNSNKIGATVARINAGIVNAPSMNSLSSLTATEIQAISDYLVSLTPPPPPPPPPGPVDGATLYSSRCASCHGAGANSTKIGATVARIDAGIVNAPSMNSLSSLTATEIQTISDYLVSLTPPSPPPPGPGPVDGSALYDTNCAGCHGPGNSSAKAGATVTRIENSIVNIPSMTGLSSLSAADIQAIADFLVGVSTGPMTNEDLYVANCGACHGADGSGGSGGGVRGDSASKITKEIQSTSEMQYLSFLTNQEIDYIAQFLNGDTVTLPGTGTGGGGSGGGGTGGGTGSALYETNCASCHGSGSNSAKAGASVVRINNSIANVASMNGLSSLSAADIQAISDYLVSLAPTTPPTGNDGSALYTSNCASCHGPGSNSAKAGATVTRIENSIVNVPSMTGLSSLSAADIQAIADFLAGVSTGPMTNEDLYVAHCGACHGADGRGGSEEGVLGDSANKIASEIQGVREMQYLSFLTSEEIEYIAQYLNGETVMLPGTDTGGGGSGGGGTGGGTGSVLYETNCGGCHGPGSNSTKAGASVIRIDNGIANVGSMNGLSSLSAADIQAIADFLATTSAPTTPQGLYAANCAACHGADGSGGSSGENVRGDSASKISSAIRKEREMQYLGFLSSNEIQEIANYLSQQSSSTRTSSRTRYRGRRGND